MSDVSSTTSTPSGMTGAGGGNMLRITGMASGLDVDAMVKKMMMAEQTKIDKAKQAQQTIQWKQDAYQDIIKDVKDLQSTYFNSLTPDTNVLLSSNYAAFDATVKDSNMLAVTPGVTAQAGTYTIDFTGGHVAAKASVTGANIVNNTSNGYGSGNIGLVIGGGTVQNLTMDTYASVDDAVTSINTQINANSTLKGKVYAVVSGNNIQFQALTDSSVKIDAATTTVTQLNNISGKVINPSLSTTMADLGLSGSDSFDITYNGTTKTISANSTDKLSDVINSITNATSGAVTASFSQLTGKFVLQSANTGSSQSVTIAKGTGTGSALIALGMADATGTPNASVVAGKDAVVTITPPGGTAVTVTKASNNFTIDGVTYNLQSEVNSTGGSSTTFSVTQDTQKVYDKIKGFIDKYNAIVDKIQTKLTEKKSSDYAPLTDTQKASMSASQISSWEDKAKVGILRNDDNLQSMLTSLRSAFTTGVANTGLSFGQYGTNSIGLDTSNDITQGGKIIIEDATKLKNAISQHGDQILKLFTNVSTSTDKTTQFSENGIFQRINNIVNDNVGHVGTSLNSAILTKYANYQDNFSNYGGAGDNTLPDQLYQQTQLLKNLSTEYNTKQEAYYQQFSALETALTTLNSQQSMLSSMIG